MPLPAFFTSKGICFFSCSHEYFDIIRCSIVRARSTLTVEVESLEAALQGKAEATCLEGQLLKSTVPTKKMGVKSYPILVEFVSAGIDSIYQAQQSD